MRLAGEILRDASIRLCPTFSSRCFMVGSSYLRTPSVRYFVFAVELTLARAKLAIGRRVKERRARIAQATEPNMCQQSSRLDRAGPGLSRPNPNHGWGSVVVVVGVEPTQARALGLA